MAPGGQRLKLTDFADYLARRVEGAGVGAYAAAAVGGGGKAFATAGGRGQGSGGAVEVSTPFHICSCSKAFTALAFEGLSQEGLADWDGLVAEVVPEFAPADRWIAGHCTFRDLAGMRVGLTREGIAEWGFRAEAPVEARLSRVGAMALDTPFRDRFSYSNLNYIALATAVGRLAGRSFPECLSQLVFQPLGLKAAALQASREAAEPQMPIGGRMTPVPELTGDNSQGSARVYLSAEVALSWLEAMLDRARAGSEPFACQSLVRPQIRATALPTTWGYGFGWSLASFDGRLLFCHGGGGRGWRTMMALDPAQGAAAMVMLAHEGDEAEALTWELLALVTGRRPQRLTTAVAARAQAQCPPSRPPAAPSPPYPGDPAGLYRGAVTGLVRISAAEGGLRFAAEDAPAFDGRLAPAPDGDFCLEFDNPAMTPMPRDPAFAVRFVAQADGRPAAEAGYFGRLHRIAA